MHVAVNVSGSSGQIKQLMPVLRQMDSFNWDLILNYRCLLQTDRRNVHTNTHTHARTHTQRRYLCSCRLCTSLCPQTVCLSLFESCHSNNNAAILLFVIDSDVEVDEGKHNHEIFDTFPGICAIPVRRTESFCSVF